MQLFLITKLVNKNWIIFKTIKKSNKCHRNVLTVYGTNETIPGDGRRDKMLEKCYKTTARLTYLEKAETA